MKNQLLKFIAAAVLTMLCGFGISAKNNTLPANTDGEAADDLDLYAVAELFKDSENLEKFEQALNSAANGVNNLDLNEDDKVDFIRVTEQTKDNLHLIVLQVPLSEAESQDVATIAVEKESGENYNLQIQGDEQIYGANYYVVPAHNNFNAWNVVRWIFSPNYRVYVSPFNYRTMPRWWMVNRPVALNVYRSRTVNFAGRGNFTATKTVRVKTIGKVNYTPRTSALVTKKTKVSEKKVTIQSRQTPNNSGSNSNVKVKTKVVKRRN